MIKTLILTFLTFFLTNTLIAQDSLLFNIFPLSNGKIVYEKTFYPDSVKKDALLKRAADWVVNIYNPQKDSNATADGSASTLLYKGFFSMLFKEPATQVAAQWECWQSIKIACEDDKVHIIITDLEQRTPSGYGTINSIPIAAMKNKLDSLPKATFFGRNTREKYWNAELATFKQIDKKIKSLMASFERTIKSGKPE